MPHPSFNTGKGLAGHHTRIHEKAPGPRSHEAKKRGVGDGAAEEAEEDELPLIPPISPSARLPFLLMATMTA